jgi:dephospho-CoA kinase
LEVIGLTGGIGTGKSTVAEILRELGAVVIDADEGARAVVEPGTSGLKAVIAEFGPEYAPEGRLDREKLAQLVFRDESALRRLNAIVHPLVRQWAAERTAQAAAEGAVVVVQDIPLLYENGLEAMFPKVIVVYAPPDVQVARLVAKGMPEDHALDRLATQLPIDEKRLRATWVIDNSGSLEATRRQVERLWTEITAEAGIGP